MGKFPRDGDYIFGQIMSNLQLARFTPPVPESCMWEKPVISLLSDANPPCFSFGLLTSATAFAMPSQNVSKLSILQHRSLLPNGSVAPGNTWPVVEISSLTFRFLK
jgi:hypothetical protein